MDMSYYWRGRYRSFKEGNDFNFTSLRTLLISFYSIYSERFWVHAGLLNKVERLRPYLVFMGAVLDDKFEHEKGHQGISTQGMDMRPDNGIDFAQKRLDELVQSTSLEQGTNGKVLDMSLK